MPLTFIRSYGQKSYQQLGFVGQNQRLGTQDWKGEHPTCTIHLLRREEQGNTMKGSYAGTLGN